MSMVFFPAEFVYWESVPDETHTKMKEKILPKILSIEDKEMMISPASLVHSSLNDWFEDGKGSKSSNVEMLNDLELLTTVVREPVNKVLQKVSKMFPLQIEDLCIDSYWWNVYERGFFQEWHSHQGPPTIKTSDSGKPTLLSPFLSAIYILNDDNDSGSTVFQHTPVALADPLDEIIFDTRSFSEIKEGTVLIFPSGLKHCVRPVASPGRVTLSFNILAKFPDSANKVVTNWPVTKLD